MVFCFLSLVRLRPAKSLVFGLALHVGFSLESGHSSALGDQGRPSIPKNCLKLQGVWYSFTAKFGGDLLTLGDTFDAKEVTSYLDARCEVTDLPV